MITLEGFYMGRDATHASELTDEIRSNALVTVERSNKLLALYIAATGDERPRRVNSGWRPAAVNAVIGGARKSHHMMGRAIDIADASKALKRWLMTEAGQAALVSVGLWMEHPDATPSWVHLQITPPRSGRRVFQP
jgi:uncharacterized protein YcbK (DUF882 family)